MIKVFLVILNWNRAKDTIECLNSIRRLSITGYRLTVVVVDNASTNNSIERIRRSVKKLSNKLLRCKIIENKENLGYAGGNNVGIRYALENNADYVVVLNNDTILDRKLMVKFLKTAKKYPKAGIISPKIYFAKRYEFHKRRYKKSELGKVIWSAGGEMDWENVFGKNRGVDIVDKGQYDETREIEFATGTCMFLRAKALREIGMFDEKFFMYFEDTDISQRFLKKGWKIVYQPKAVLWHKVAQSSGPGSDLNDYYITRNRMLFGMRYAKLRTKIALIRESARLLMNGRDSQRKGIVDCYLGNFGKGGWNEKEYK